MAVCLYHLPCIGQPFRGHGPLFTVAAEGAAPMVKDKDSQSGEA